MFQSKSRFQTPIGGLISCLTLTLFTSFFVVCTIRLVSKSDPFFSMITIGCDMDAVDLQQLQFFFAIEKPAPHLGRVNAYHTSWDNKTGKTKTDLELIDCAHYFEGGKHAHLLTGA